MLFAAVHESGDGTSRHFAACRILSLPGNSGHRSSSIYEYTAWPTRPPQLKPLYMSTRRAPDPYFVPSRLKDGGPIMAFARLPFAAPRRLDHPGTARH